MVWGKQGGGDEMKWFGLEDVGAALLYKRVSDLSFQRSLVSIPGGLEGDLT